MIVQSDKKLMLDFVTVVDNEAQLITEGLSAEEQATEDEAVERNQSWNVGKGYKAKSAREASFPLQLLERGYSIDITKAEASRKDDKRTILNTIAGGVESNLLTTQEPDLQNPEFERVNKRLRGMFAEAAINKAAKGGHLREALECLTDDVERTSLRLDFRGCSELQAFAKWARLGEMQLLEELKLEEARALKVLPDSISDLVHLQTLDLQGSKSLMSLPEGEVMVLKLECPDFLSLNQISESSNL